MLRGCLATDESRTLVLTEVRVSFRGVRAVRPSLLHKLNFDFSHLLILSVCRRCRRGVWWVWSHDGRRRPRAITIRPLHDHQDDRVRTLCPTSKADAVPCQRRCGSVAKL